MLPSWLAGVLRRSAWYHYFKDTLTPLSMGCVIAVTVGSKNLTSMRPLSKVGMLSLGWEGALSSSNIALCGNPSFSGKPKLWNKMVLEQIFKSLPIHLCSFLVLVMRRNAVYFITLEESSFFGFSNYCKFQFVISRCISTAHDRFVEMPDLCLRAHFCLSKARFLVGKSFQH